MKRIISILLLTIFCAFSSVSTFASTLDEIAKIENKKSQEKIDRYSIEQNREKNIVTLSNGVMKDISRWQIVHFMSSNCQYCIQFNPVLKHISEQIKIPVFTYSFDGKGDSYFPTVIPTNSAITDTFFAELPMATPTDFLVNIDTLMTVPISQGAISYDAFIKRLNDVFIIADDLERDLKNDSKK